MQSGITASAELQSAFTNLLSSPTTRAIIATISATPETLIPSQTIPTTPTHSLADDLPSISSALSPTRAAYILLREDAAGPAAKAVAVTYVPDGAPVREKMLYASTRLALVRELGGARVGGALFATAADELSPAGWARQVAQGGVAAPLTSEEESLAGLREAEAAESGGTGARRGGHVVAGGVSMAVDEGAVGALRELAAAGGGAVQLNIALPKETISLVSTHSAADATPATLQSLLSTTQPRYTFYKHAATGAVLFLYTCPAGCSVKERMVYAASTRSIPVVAQAEAGLDAPHKIEASEVDEVTAAAILDEVEPKAAETKPVAGGASAGGFARPKRPGRR